MLDGKPERHGSLPLHLPGFAPPAIRNEQGREARTDALFIPVFKSSTVGMVPMNKSRLITVAMAVAAIAIINRVPQAKKIVYGQ